MKEEVLRKVRNLREETEKLNEKYGHNKKRMKELEKDKNVEEYIRLLEENNKIKYIQNLNNYFEKITINKNCSHDICLFINSECDEYEGRRYYNYKCVECGYEFEAQHYCRPKYEIGILKDKNSDFNMLNNEYINLLIKYNTSDAHDFMIYKYVLNNPTFNTLINDGIDVNRAIKLTKKITIYNK